MDDPLKAPPAGRARLSWSARAADRIVIALAVGLGGGSLVLFLLAGRLMLLPMHLSSTAALWWNGFLSLVFFTQHSVMVRRSVRAHLAAVIPERYDGALYSITSGLALIFVAVLYQPISEPPLFVLHGPGRLIVNMVALLAAVTFVWGVLALRTFDPFGVRPIRKHLRGDPFVSSTAAPSGNKVFVVRGPYRWVRHPLYSAVIVLLWANPEMNVGHMEMAVLWTAWIFVGTLLEERDLTADFGETHRKYRERVPMLVPWRRPMPVQPAERLDSGQKQA